jgi:hypothetical protein
MCIFQIFLTRFAKITNESKERGTKNLAVLEIFFFFVN